MSKAVSIQVFGTFATGSVQLLHFVLCYEILRKVLKLIQNHQKKTELLGHNLTHKRKSGLECRTLNHNLHKILQQFPDEIYETDEKLGQNINTGC